MFEFLLPLLLLVLFVPIFLSGRKQRKQAAEMQEMQRALEEGDVVVTTSGLRGIVTDASFEDTIDLEIADGVVTTWVRAAVREKVVVDEPADDLPADDDLPAGDKSVEARSTDDTPAEAGPSLTKDETPRG